MTLRSLREGWNAAYPHLALSEGIVGSLNRSMSFISPATVPSPAVSAFPYSSLRSLISASRWPGRPRLVNVQSGIESAWTYRMQGVAHDKNFWFFTNETDIFRAPLANPDKAEIGPRPGWGHGGGMSLFKGFLYVAVERSSEGQVWVVDPNTLTVVDRFDLDSADGRSCPWLSINPVTGILYTTVYNPHRSNQLRIFKLFPHPGPLGPKGRRAELLSVQTLSGEDGGEIDLRELQAGLVTPNNHIMLMSDSDDSSITGLHLFDLLSGRRRWHELGFAASLRLYGQKIWEAEAMAVIDWGSSGYLHSFSLDKATLGARDQVMIKHFDFGVPLDRERL